MQNTSGSISRRNRVQNVFSIVAVVVGLGFFSTTAGVKAQGGCPYPYDACETTTLRSTMVELKEEGGNVRGNTRAQFFSQGNGVINTTLDVNSADLFSWQLGGSKIRIMNLDTGQLLPPSPVEYCSARFSCNHKDSSFTVMANTRYAAELEVDYGALVLPLKDYYLSAHAAGIPLDSRNVSLREEGGEVRGLARVQFTPESDRVIEWNLNATGPNNIPDWVGPAGQLVKHWLIQTLAVLNSAEEYLPSQLGGSKLLIRNVNTGELVLPPQEFCHDKLPLCGGISGSILVSKGIKYEAELSVDYGILVHLIRDHKLTAVVSEMVELDPPDERCENAIYFDLPYSGNLEFSGDQDWQRIKSPVKGTMVLTLDVPPDKDYQLEVRNDACSAVWVGSQNGTGVDEQIVMPVDPVYYRVHVFGKTPTDLRSWYSVSATWDLDDNQWEKAVKFDIPFTGNLEYSGDQDWQRINVPAGGTFLVLDVPEGKNYQLESWRDDVKTQLGSSTNGTGLDESIFVSQPGNYRVHIFGANPATDFGVPYRVFLDGVAPSTTTALAGTMGNSGWYRSNVQVTLQATDNPGGSGVRRIEYSFNGTPWNVYSVPFTISAEGQTTLVYRATDIAGNVEPNQTQLIKIDKTPPVITIASPQVKNYAHTASITVTWIANDALSGMASQSGTLDGNPVTNGQAIDLFFQSLGAHTVVVNATDQAGNTHRAAAAFSVTADANSLSAAADRALALGWIAKTGTADSLGSKLDAIKSAIARGQFNAAKNQLNAFLNELDAQKGKAVNQQAYDLLKADVIYVLGHLP